MTGERAHGIRDEGGQVITAIILLAFLASLFVFGVAVVPLGRATDERSRAENAADAAALAGAKAVDDRLDRFRSEGAGAFGDPEDALRWVLPGLGQAEAADFAGRNGAVLRDYWYDPAADRVEVSVELIDPGVGDGGPAEGDAAAAIGTRLRPCSTSPSVADLRDALRAYRDAVEAWAEAVAAFVPDPLADPPTLAPEAPPVPDPVPVETACGTVRVRFEFRFDDGRFHLGSVHAGPTQPRLVA